MIISKYLIEENVFSPAKTSSIILEKVYENEQQLVNTETLFNNIVNYENDAPFDVLRQSFNNMTQILKTFATVDVDTLYKKVDDLLNKDYGNQVGYSMNKKIPQKVITGARGETSNMWSWSAKSDSNKIINKIMNDEKYEFIDIVSQFAEEVDNSTTLTNEVTELVAAGKSVNVEELTKQFNAIYDMFLQMYKMDIVPHNLNKMRTKKSFDEVKREYFLGLLTGLYTTFIGKILEQSSSRRIKSFIIKNISVLGMYLNEEPKQIVVVQKEKEEKESTTSRTNKDDILNSFLTEDLDNIEYEEQEVVGLDDEESDDLMLELFGEE
jgi:hypothetical protein